MFGIIYKATSPSGKVYIGQTSSPLYQRILEHKRKALNKNSDLYNTKFSRAIRKYKHEIVWDTIEYKISIMKLSEKEMFYIAKYDSFINGYNMTLGGEGTRGVDHSGNKNSFYDKHHTEELKKRFSEDRKGKGVGNNNAFYGKKHTDNSLEKMRGPRNCLWENNANATSYAIQSLKGEIFIFYGRKSLQKFLENLNNSLRLFNYNRISWTSLTKKKPYISQGWNLIYREKINV